VANACRGGRTAVGGGAGGAGLAIIYKICRAGEWQAAQSAGTYAGSDVDRRDGFVHFSTAAQVAETARRHFAGQSDLVLVAVDDALLGPDVRYEPSRGGALFPHLYGHLDPAAALWVKPLPIGPGGTHIFPALA
jgi:uncharacterized protein (DUF952 family)